MKRNVKLNLSVLVLVLFFSLAFTGCEEPEEIYTVWTASITYSQFQTIFGSQANINDNGIAAAGYVITDGRNGRAAQLLSAGGQKKDMTEIEISNHITTWGVTKNQADEFTGYFTSYDHGYVATRSGTSVKVIMK